MSARVDEGQLMNRITTQRTMSDMSQSLQKQRHLVHQKCRCNVVEIGGELDLDLVRETLEDLYLVSNFVKGFKVGAKRVIAIHLVISTALASLVRVLHC